MSGTCPPRRRDARPLPRVTPRPAGGDDPLKRFSPERTRRAAGGARGGAAPHGGRAAPPVLARDRVLDLGARRGGRRRATGRDDESTHPVAVDRVSRMVERMTHDDDGRGGLVPVGDIPIDALGDRRSRCHPHPTPHAGSPLPDARARGSERHSTPAPGSRLHRCRTTAGHPAPRHTTIRHTTSLAIAPARVPSEKCGASTWSYVGEW